MNEWAIALGKETMYAFLDGNSSDGYPFKVHSNFENLNLTPILKSLLQGNSSKTKGEIDE